MAVIETIERIYDKGYPKYLKKMVINIRLTPEETRLLPSANHLRRVFGPAERYEAISIAHKGQLIIHINMDNVPFNAQRGADVPHLVLRRVKAAFNRRRRVRDKK